MRERNEAQFFCLIQGLSAHERVLEAEYLVEKTLDSFVECLQRCSEGG